MQHVGNKNKKSQNMRCYHEATQETSFRAQESNFRIPFPISFLLVLNFFFIIHPLHYNNTIINGNRSEREWMDGIEVKQRKQARNVDEV